MRDLYDLMEWTQDCPSNQQLPIDNGKYTPTLCSNIPSSGLHGDNQVIEGFMEKSKVLPRLANEGDRHFCTDKSKFNPYKLELFENTRTG